jgi:hypothetical protein
MVSNQENKVNAMIKTEDSKRVLDYLAHNRELSSSGEIKSYLNLSMENTIDALNSLEEQGFVKHNMVGPILCVYEITADGVEKNNEAKMKTF